MEPTVLGSLRSLLGGGDLPDPLPASPMLLLESWYTEAIKARREPNPDAMVLASASRDGAPSARVVLCKRMDAAAGTVVFFTNYESRKGQELLANPRAAGVFHWDHATRQARIEGSVEKADASVSDEYFNSRPLLSRLGAWASEQSRPITSRMELVDRVMGVMKRFDIGMVDVVRGQTGKALPRPPHWGGFKMTLEAVELWCGGQGRLHDRARWTRTSGVWQGTRVAP